MSRLFSARQLLLPLVPAYRLALLLRELRLRLGLEPLRSLRHPVVSIGNLSTGGSGKTPLTIALAKALKQRGCVVDVLSRGYGRRSKHAACVRPDGRAEEFGDEPLLIARRSGVPVYVGRQRFEAGQMAEGELVGQGFSPDASAAQTAWALAPEVGFSEDLPLNGSSPKIQKTPILNSLTAVHLLDDGFQHRQLHREVNILLLDKRDWQDSLLPAGNLREPLHAARRATIIAIPAGEPALEAALRAWGWQGPIWRLQRTMEVPAVEGPVAAFCGIARPEQFFEGLEAGGLKLCAHIAFPDHHRFTVADLKRLTATARAAEATALITTEKDLVRLGQIAQALPESLPLLTAGLHIEIENEDEVLGWLLGRLAVGPARPPL
jgi:tetraacyldisaccharide 4'-kinase